VDEGRCGYYMLANRGRTSGQTLSPWTFGNSLSDEDLLAYDWDTINPEQVPNWTKARPSPDISALRFLKRYDLPHATGSRAGMIWCVFCQERNHFRGFVVEYSDGSTRTLGRCCRVSRSDDLPDEIDALRVRFDELRQRALLVRDFRALREPVRALAAELKGLEAHPSLSGLDHQRTAFANNLEGLLVWLQGTIKRNDGAIVWEEEVEQTARSEALSQPSATKGAQTPPQRRFERFLRRHQLQGRAFLSLGLTPQYLLSDLQKRVTALWAFSSPSETDDLSLAELRAHVSGLPPILRGVRELEALLRSPLEFFSPKNLSAVATARNSALGKRTYAVRKRALTRVDDDGRQTMCELSSGYRPWKSKSAERVESLLGR